MLAVTPDGTVYFGSGDGFDQEPPIGRINPALAAPGTSNGITWVRTPDNAPSCCAAIFRDMSWSTFDNRLYWSRSDLTIGTLAGDVVTANQIPNSPWGIVAAPEGGAWLAEYGSSNVGPAYTGNRLARVSSGLGLSEYPNLGMQTGTWDGTRYDAKPAGHRRRAGRQALVHRVRRRQPGLPARHHRRRHLLPRVPPLPDGGAVLGHPLGSALGDLDVAADGTVWYTNELKKTIGALRPGTAQYAEFALADISGSAPAHRSRSARPRTAPCGPPSTAASARRGRTRSCRSRPPHHRRSRCTSSAPRSRRSSRPDTHGNVWFSGSPGAGAAPSVASRTPSPCHAQGHSGRRRCFRPR